jgi:ABC-type glycerol-3-phosphate transport system substrate-binding protein
MKKVLLALAAVALFAACGGNSNNSDENTEDTTTYEQVKQQIDSTVAENAPEIIQEEWKDGGEIVWDD